MVPQLTLNAYSSEIRLNEAVVHDYTLLTEQEKVDIVDSLLRHLGVLESQVSLRDLPEEYGQKRKLLRALLTIRTPKALDEPLLQRLNSLLQHETFEKGIVQLDEIETDMYPGSLIQSGLEHTKLLLWQGDITRLGVDAIVNAANNQMLGCFQPTHLCIDNVIHAAAGPQLRADCQIIMDKQQTLERTGNAKITRAYNLPSRYVLHTVGPIYTSDTDLQERHQTDLASCYTSCLNLAAQVAEIRSIAFCCISTGLYGFPKQTAANIAISTVAKWLNANPGRLDAILFNVFDKGDYELYASLLE